MKEPLKVEITAKITDAENNVVAEQETRYTKVNNLHAAIIEKHYTRMFAALSDEAMLQEAMKKS